jgi:hypothetical protein
LIVDHGGWAETSAESPPDLEAHLDRIAAHPSVTAVVCLYDAAVMDADRVVDAASAHSAVVMARPAPTG